MPVDIAKFMNTLVSSLQSDAWDRDVRLVLDASTPIFATFDEAALQGSIHLLLATLIHSAASDSSITVVTAFNPPLTPNASGTLQITITAAAFKGTEITLLLQSLREMIADNQGSFLVERDSTSWTCNIELPATTVLEVERSKRLAVVVDDDVDMQDFLREVLEMSGFRVIAVNDGFDALIVIERYQPDVVLTDVLMPNMNGIDLVGRIKAARGDLPVIVFSGYYDSLIKQSIQFGSLPDYILPKPMTQLQVVTALNAVLSKGA